MAYISKFFLLVAISFTLQHIGNAQDDYYLDRFEAGQVIPPSPTASSLSKYVDIPVSLYTGVPEITIPIFNIENNKFRLPVYLSYHSNGNKASETASWTGLGWSLNAGGIITRSVKGLPDDKEHWEYDPGEGFLTISEKKDNFINIKP